MKTLRTTSKCLISAPEIGELVKVDGVWTHQTTCNIYRVDRVSAPYHDRSGHEYRIVDLSEVDRPRHIPLPRDLLGSDPRTTAANLRLVQMI